MIAAHLGVIDEEAIGDMSFVFFSDVLAELNHKITFDAVSGYAGNSFFEKSWDMIMEHHPQMAGEMDTVQKEEAKTLQGLAALLGG